MQRIEEDLKKLVNKIAAEHGYRKHEVVLNEVNTENNFTSKLFTVIVKETNKNDLHLFAKVATLGEKIRSVIGWQLFSTEFIAYKKLSDVYEYIQEENGVPEEHKLFFPRFYRFDPTWYQETLVLENLVTKGFSPYDRFTSIDWEYASSAITELAKFHALSLAYSEKYPEDYRKILEDIKVDWKEGSLEFLSRNSIETALRSVVPKYKEALRGYLRKYFKDSQTTAFTPIRRAVIVHGDFRGSNVMYRVREDGKVDIKIVDLQTLQGGSPVSDLLYFIFTGSDEQFRAQYYDKLIDHYYTQLSEAMKRLHLNPEEIYSREDFDYELKEKLPFGLSLAVFALPVVTVGTENAPQVNEDLEFSSLSVENTSDLYVERLNGVINDYVKWGLLK